jgi:hypothetical protein
MRDSTKCDWSTGTLAEPQLNSTAAITSVDANRGGVFDGFVAFRGGDAISFSDEDCNASTSEEAFDVSDQKFE